MIVGVSMLAGGSGSNRLFACLPPENRDAFAAHGEVVPLVKGHELARAGDLIVSCWFPFSGLVSVIAADEDGNEAEVGIIGHEGMVGSGTLVGSRRSAMRLLIQIGGSALRVDARTVMSVAAGSHECLAVLTAFHQSLAIQAAYSALAYAQYPIVKRLARWMLMCADRVGDNIDLTHETLAIMLGVRRAGVTVALQTLETKGAITRQRGVLRIADRSALLVLASSGYGSAEEEYRHLLHL